MHLTICFLGFCFCSFDLPRLLLCFIVCVFLLLKQVFARYLTLCPHITLLYSYFPLYYALLTCYYLNISDCTVEEASTAQMYYIFTLKTRHFKQIVGSCLIRLFVTFNCHKPLFLIYSFIFSYIYTKLVICSHAHMTINFLLYLAA